MNDPEPSSSKLNPAHVRQRFDRAAAGFAEADFVHRHCFAGILERLEPMQLRAERVLDLGCAAGAGGRALAKTYRRSRIYSVDLSLAMLRAARRARSRFARPREIQASAAALPFPSGSFDLIVANLLLPWIDRPDTAFAEIRRVLRKDGLFAFSSLGPGSFLELRNIWRQEDDFSHVNAFADMHNTGDALVRAGLADPVLDVDTLAITYRDGKDLLRDLKRAGAGNALAGRQPTLTGKRRLGRVIESLHQNGGAEPIAVHLELVYGHAFGTGTAAAPGEFRVDPGAIGRIRR